MRCPNCGRPCRPEDLFIHDADCDACEGLGRELDVTHCGCFYTATAGKARRSPGIFLVSHTENLA